MASLSSQQKRRQQKNQQKKPENESVFAKAGIPKTKAGNETEVSTNTSTNIDTNTNNEQTTNDNIGNEANNETSTEVSTEKQEKESDEQVLESDKSDKEGAEMTNENTNNNEGQDQQETPKRKNAFQKLKVQVAELPRKVEKKQVSVYLDIDVAEVFNLYGSQAGKGAKSDLINKFLKESFASELEELKELKNQELNK